MKIVGDLEDFARMLVTGKHNQEENPTSEKCENRNNKQAEKLSVTSCNCN